MKALVIFGVWLVSAGTAYAQDRYQIFPVYEYLMSGTGTKRASAFVLDRDKKDLFFCVVHSSGSGVGDKGQSACTKRATLNVTINSRTSVHPVRPPTNEHRYMDNASFWFLDQERALVSYCHQHLQVFCIELALE